MGNYLGVFFCEKKKANEARNRPLFVVRRIVFCTHTFIFIAHNTARLVRHDFVRYYLVAENNELLINLGKLSRMLM